MTNAKLLKDALSDKRISNADLAKALGIDRSTLYRRVKSNTLTVGDVQKIVSYLSLSDEQAKSIFLF